MRFVPHHSGSEHRNGHRWSAADVLEQAHVHRRRGAEHAGLSGALDRGAAGDRTWDGDAESGRSGTSRAGHCGLSLHAALSRSEPVLHMTCLHMYGAVAIAIASTALAGAPPLAAQELFVSNEGSNTVTVVSAATLQPLATIQVGKRPRGIALSPDGQRVYVALGLEDAVAVIDVASRAVVDKLPAGPDPEQVAVSGDGGTVYVSNESAARATGIRVADRQQLFSVAVGKEPEGVGVTPDGRRVFITGESDSSVTILDAQTGRLLGAFHVPARPRFVTFDRERNRAFVSSENGGTLSIVDMRRDTVLGVVHIADGTTKPTGIALAPDGHRAYVANGAGNRVTVIDPAAARVITAIRVGTRPWGVALSSDGATLYTADGRSKQISVIDTQSGRVRATIPVGERPYSLVVVPGRNGH